MSPMNEREMARRLRAERGREEPPPELLARIKSEIPPAITVSPRLAVAGGEAQAALRRRRWLLAASLLAALGTGELGWLLMRGMPVPLARRASREEAAPPAASTGRPEGSVEASRPVSPSPVPPAATSPSPRRSFGSPPLPAGPSGVPEVGTLGSEQRDEALDGTFAPQPAAPLEPPRLRQPSALPAPLRRVAPPERLRLQVPPAKPGEAVPGGQAGGLVVPKVEERLQATAESPLPDERKAAKAAPRRVEAGSPASAGAPPASPPPAREPQFAPPSADSRSASVGSVSSGQLSASAQKPTPVPGSAAAPAQGSAAAPAQDAAAAPAPGSAPENEPWTDFDRFDAGGNDQPVPGAAASGERMATLEIVVENAGRRPLSGVVVRIAGAGPTETRTTDAAGRAVFTGLGPGPHALRAELPGYLPYASSRVEVAGGKSLRIRLLPLPAAGIGAGRQPTESGGFLGRRAGAGAADLLAAAAGGEDVLDRLRRDLDAGRLPPPGAVSVRELVDAFDYGDPLPVAAGEARASLAAAPSPPRAWLGGEGALAPAGGAGAARRARLRFGVRAQVLPAGTTLRAVFSPQLVRRYREAGSPAWVSARHPARLALATRKPAPAVGESTARESAAIAASWLFEVELVEGVPGASGADAAGRLVGATGAAPAPDAAGAEGHLAAAGAAGRPDASSSAPRAGREEKDVGRRAAAPLATVSLELPDGQTAASRSLRRTELATSWAAAPVNLRLAFVAAEFAAHLGEAPALREVAAQARSLAASYPGDARAAELARLTARAAELRSKAAATTP
jgi:hypothetical protein